LDGSLEIGEYLQKRKITNPDCPDLRYKIDVYYTEKNGKSENKKVMPMIMIDYTKDTKYKKGKEITSYIQSELFPIELAMDTPLTTGTTDTAISSNTIITTSITTMPITTTSTTIMPSATTIPTPSTTITTSVPNTTAFSTTAIQSITTGGILRAGPLWRVVGSENTQKTIGINPLRDITDKDIANGIMASKIDLEFNTKINFHEITGGNTFYISHPEEIMADNVAMLAMFLGSYDIDELDETGIAVLQQIAQVFGDDVYKLFTETLTKARAKRTKLNTRQKKRLRQGSINFGRRQRQKINKK